jgi:YtkA-like
MNMRVRPFFWVLLVLTCCGVLAFAATVQIAVPLLLRVELMQQPPRSGEMTTLTFHMTDSQGLPIDDARLESSARMTNMVMETQPVKIAAFGQGVYVIQLDFSMPGPWIVTVSVQAAGFLAVQRTIPLQVQ